MAGAIDWFAGARPRNVIVTEKTSFLSRKMQVPTIFMHRTEDLESATRQGTHSEKRINSCYLGNNGGFKQTNCRFCLKKFVF
jgi:hypothetical protein